jgi:apolipoprotein D and lipocalin family protein
MSMFRVVLVFLVIGLAGCVGKYPPLETVKQVDLSKYQGTWYEIASFPASFQRGCSCTSATYQTVKNENYITVYNRCRRNGSWSDINGKAYVVPNSHNAKLKVQFFWPFRGDYWILHIDKASNGDYQHVLVGNPSRKYLWILSRSRTISRADKDRLAKIAKEKGFDTQLLQTTGQDSCADSASK